jgi:hypothetical protein
MALTPVSIPLAPYAPDMSDYTNGYSDAILNVEPHLDGYGPLPSWSAIGTGLGAACKGAITVRLATGSTAIFAGTAVALFKYDSSTLTWTDYTRLVGGAYAVASGTYWSFAQFGPYLVACNGVDANQVINVDSGTNFAALTNSPKASYVTTLGDHLLLGKLETDFRAIAWSGVNDATYWTYGYRGSDTQVMPDGGDVQAVVGQGQNAYIMQQDSYRIIRWVGGNYVFKVEPVEPRLGCYAPYSVIADRNTFFWYSQAGFFMGAEAKPIGHERVNRFVIENVDPTERKKIRAFIDPNKNIVGFLMLNISGSYMLLGYNWALDKWFPATTVVDYIFAAISPGYTIDGMAAISATIDGLPYPVDSPFWGGSGLQNLAGFNASGSFGYYTGDAMAATVETIDLEMTKGAHNFVNCIRLDGDTDYQYLTGMVGVRRFPGAAITYSDSTAADSDSGKMWIRKRGATHRFRVTIASHDWEHADAITAWAKPAGTR